MKKEGILFALIILLMVSLIFAGELRVTQEHPFFVDDEWVTASDLQVGDELITSDGSLVRITSIKDVSENVEVYNLDSSETDDFVVGEENIVVHNSEEASICPKPKTEPIPDTYKLPEKGCKGKYRITPNSQVTREELIDFFGRDPIKDSKPITGIDETNINGIIGPDGKLWVVKESISAGPKEELGGDVKAESVGREIINYAGGESKNSVKTPEGFSYVGENGEAYLFYRYVEGTTFSGSETVAEQIHQVYCGDDAYEVRARMAISQILGGFKDSNNNGFIKTKDGVAQIDTEYIGSANDIGPFEFRVGVQNDLEPGFSPIPQYNNKKFADTLRCLARQELSKPESEYASRMKDALEKAGYKGEHLEKKLSELIENRRKLLEHINKRLQMLEEDGLRTYDNNLDSISSYPEDSRFSRTNPDDVTLTAQMVTPEKHISADRKAEIDLKIVNGESAKGLDDTERLYYAEKLLGRELTPEEKKQILAIHKSEESNYVKGRRARKEAGLSEDETRKLMENWVLGEETPKSLRDALINVNPQEDVEVIVDTSTLVKMDEQGLLSLFEQKDFNVIIPQEVMQELGWIGISGKIKMTPENIEYLARLIADPRFKDSSLERPKMTLGEETLLRSLWSFISKKDFRANPNDIDGILKNADGDILIFTIRNEGKTVILSEDKHIRMIAELLKNKYHVNVEVIGTSDFGK